MVNFITLDRLQQYSIQLGIIIVSLINKKMLVGVTFGNKRYTVSVTNRSQYYLSGNMNKVINKRMITKNVVYDSIRQLTYGIVLLL